MKSELLNTLKHWGHSIPDKDFTFGINLLRKKFKDEIPMAEFFKECTYFMLNCEFTSLKPQPLPTRPDKLAEYDQKRVFNRDYETKSSFWDEPDIRTYLDSQWKVIQHNKGSKAWLKENLTRLEQYGDTMNIARVRARIQEFDIWEDDNSLILDRLFKK